MTTAPDLVAQILRLYTVEKWRAGTIARQLRVHRDVVRRVIAGDSTSASYVRSNPAVVTVSPLHVIVRVPLS